ncbi:hypothetical protein [Natronococcus sp. A-GB7]|uniref:hypothetical protein n=1 Tax=Natronococcus sp. A-GB7 TaxID=3037649 RepID=UPI00241EB533|nr:hypothetical protein [Natronococcus sp. A-GB7]MDG5821839.1 hypothetical protein [Natronococcus sp. A-GB7]
MEDFSILLQRADPEDIQKALELRASDLEERTAELETERGLSSAIGVVYLACLDRDGSTIWLDDDTPEGRTFEKRANSGIRDAINRLGVTVKDVTTSLEVERGGPFDKLPNLSPKELADEYSMMELQRAHLNEIITDEQFFGAMEEQGRIVQQGDE